MNPDLNSYSSLAAPDGGIWGLRVHPKFSLTITGTDGEGNPDIQCVYSHERWPLVMIYQSLDVEQRRYAEFQRWDPTECVPGTNKTGWVQWTPRGQWTPPKFRAFSAGDAGTSSFKPKDEG